ncbi:MAG: dockerin type I repeat-containing protein [Clostridia bacterium]|nr:dockerin type I repeat-containing protein [Clostridia bacterium]
MRKFWKYFILVTLLGALMCTAAFAVDEPTFTGFDEETTEFTLDGDGEKFEVTYTGATSGQYLILMVAEGTDGAYTITDESIMYVNQDAATEDGVSFTVYPTKMVNAKIMLGGGTGGPVTLGYLEMPVPDVTVDVMDTTGTVSAEISADGSTLVVENDQACVVLYTTDGGETYEALEATKNDDGSYNYDLTQLPAGAEVTVAVKGDLNGDGKISALEARRILLASNGNYELTALQQAIADENGDGKVSALEARRYLLASNGNYDPAW